MLTELTFKRLNKQYNLSLNQSKLMLKQGFGGPGILEPGAKAGAMRGGSWVACGKNTEIFQ